VAQAQHGAQEAPASATAPTRAPVAPLALESPSAIYDLAQEDSPLMVFEAADGSTVIWMLEGDDNVSHDPSTRDGWA
jgi:hypothetical protein